MASQNAGAMMEIKCLLMIGGRQQARELKFKEKRAKSPSSSWVLGQFGNVEIDAFFTGSVQA
jgi:hypothetical protein